MEGRERPEKEADHSSLVVHSYNKQGYLLQSCFSAAARRLGIYAHCQNLKFIQRPSLGLATHTVQMAPQHIALARLHPWKQLLMWEGWTEHISHGSGSRWGDSNHPDPARRSTGSHLHFITSPNNHELRSKVISLPDVSFILLKKAENQGVFFFKISFFNVYNF